MTRDCATARISSRDAGKGAGVVEPHLGAENQIDRLDVDESVTSVNRRKHLLRRIDSP